MHRRSPENIARPMKVLGDIGAHFWPDLAQRHLPPRESDLAGRGQLNLQTRMGRLDVLCELNDQRGYEELLAHTEEVALGGMGFSMLLGRSADTRRDCPCKYSMTMNRVPSSSFPYSEISTKPR